MSSTFFNLFVDIFMFTIDDKKNIIDITKKGGDHMDIRKYIKLCLTAREISESELARRLGTTPQNFNQKMTGRTIKVRDLDDIADAIGAEVSLSFIDKATGKPII